MRVWGDFRSHGQKAARLCVEPELYIVAFLIAYLTARAEPKAVANKNRPKP